MKSGKPLCTTLLVGVRAGGRNGVPKVDFRILGPLEVLEQGESLHLSGGKKRALLVLLLLHSGESVSTERLIDALWGERPPASAANSVHIYVSQLRKTLGGGRLATNGGGYSLQLGHDELDARTFERLLGEGRALLVRGEPEAAKTMLTEALGLWRGPPLADFAYEEFARGEIARLEELRVQTTEEGIDADLALGRAGAVVAELEALVRTHPLRERLRGQLMLALYQVGRQTEALDVYRDGRRALADELGLEPGLALQQLERSVLNHDPALEARLEPAQRRASRVRGPALVAIASLALLVIVVIVAIQLRSRHTGLVSVAANSVGVIDPRTNRIVAQVPVGNTPTEVAIGEGSVWVLNSNEQTLSRIDPETKTVLRVVPTTTSASDLAVGAGAVWVAGTTQTLTRIDPEAPLGARTFGLPGAPDSLISSGEQPSRVAATTRAVWATTTGGVWRIEPAPRRRFAFGERGCCGPVAIGLGSIWIASQFGLDRIDASTGRLEAYIRLPFAPADLAVGEGGVWVSDHFTDRLWRVDPKRNAVATTIAVGQGPSGVAVGAGSVWVASADGTVSRIDPNTDRVTDRIDVGGTPSGISVGRDGVWVTVD